MINAQTTCTRKGFIAHNVYNRALLRTQAHHYLNPSQPHGMCAKKAKGDKEQEIEVGE